MTTALLIVDMQRGSFPPYGPPRHDAAGLVARLNALAVRVRDNGGSVILIQHDGPPDDPHHSEAEGWSLLPELDARPEDTVVRKTACDSFLNTQLDAVLTAHGVAQIIVTGNATDYCVDTTVRSALARGYRTLVPADGHTTADRPHLSAVQIIAHHNAIWSDFIAPGGSAVIGTCAEISV